MLCHANIWGWWAEEVYLNLGKLSVIFGMITAFVHVVYCVIGGLPVALNVTAGKMLAGFVLPPAIAMGIASIDPPNLLGCVTNLEVYICVGAFSVIWITLSIVFPGGFSSKWIESLGARLGRKRKD